MKTTFSTCIGWLGRTTTNACRPPCLPWGPARLSVPVPPPILAVTEKAETEPTPKAPEPTLHVPQSSVSNMHRFKDPENKRLQEIVRVVCLF